MNEGEGTTTRIECAKHRRVSSVAIGSAAVLAVIASPMMALGIPDPVRAVLAVTALVWAPGYAVAYLTRIEDPLFFVMIVISVGLSLNVVVSMALFYTGSWGPVTYVGVTGLITCSIAVVAIRTRSLP